MLSDLLSGGAEDTSGHESYQSRYASMGLSGAPSHQPKPPLGPLFSLPRIHRGRTLLSSAWYVLGAVLFLPGAIIVIPYLNLTQYPSAVRISWTQPFFYLGVHENNSCETTHRSCSSPGHWPLRWPPCWTSTTREA